jgi:hypothetical protein
VPRKSIIPVFGRNDAQKRFHRRNVHCRKFQIPDFIRQNVAA